MYLRVDRYLGSFHLLVFVKNAAVKLVGKFLCGVLFSFFVNGVGGFMVFS